MVSAWVFFHVRLYRERLTWRCGWGCRWRRWASGYYYMLSDWLYSFIWPAWQVGWQAKPASATAALRNWETFVKIISSGCIVVFLRLDPPFSPILKSHALASLCLSSWISTEPAKAIPVLPDSPLRTFQRLSLRGAPTDGAKQSQIRKIVWYTPL